jgi:hypothetical protein
MGNGKPRNACPENAPGAFWLAPLPDLPLSQPTDHFLTSSNFLKLPLPDLMSQVNPEVSNLL